jgi:hypothetical protein
MVCHRIEGLRLDVLPADNVYTRAAPCDWTPPRFASHLFSYSHVLGQRRRLCPCCIPRSALPSAPNTLTSAPPRRAALTCTSAAQADVPGSPRGTHQAPTPTRAGRTSWHCCARQKHNHSSRLSFKPRGRRLYSPGMQSPPAAVALKSQPAISAVALSASQSQVPLKQGIYEWLELLIQTWCSSGYQCCCTAFSCLINIKVHTKKNGHELAIFHISAE